MRILIINSSQMLIQFLQWIQLLAALYLVQNLLYLLRVELRANLCLHHDGRLQPTPTS